MNKLIPLFFLIFSIEISGDEENKLDFSNDAYPFSSEAKETLFYSLLNELRCPKCQSSNLSGSNSPISNDLKGEVYELVLKGNSAEQIKYHLVYSVSDMLLSWLPFLFSIDEMRQTAIVPLFRNLFRKEHCRH